MICNQFSSVVGLHCTPMDDSGDVALVETPFRFADGNAFPIFVQEMGSGVRFFDDCGTLWHLAGRGVDVNDGRRIKSVADIIEAFGLQFTDDGEIEVWATSEDAPQAFARMTQALLAVAAWERSSQDSDPDSAGFVEDVAAAIELANGAGLLRNVQFKGVTGQTIVVDIQAEKDLVYACKPRSQSTSAVLRKLIDLNNGQEAAALMKWAVIDDRDDPDAASREAMILSTVAEVRLFSSLVRDGLQRAAQFTH